MYHICLYNVKIWNWSRKIEMNTPNRLHLGCGRPDCQSQNIRKMKEVIQIAQQAGFEVRDVIPDGNCMFAAVVDQLNMYGDNRFGHKSLREAAVTWLIEHPYNEDGTHYSSFMSEDWQTYIQRMVRIIPDDMSLCLVCNINNFIINYKVKHYLPRRYGKLQYLKFIENLMKETLVIEDGELNQLSRVPM